MIPKSKLTEYLDALLAIGAEKYLNDPMPSPELIQEANIPDVQIGLFLVEALVDEGYFKPYMPGYSSVPFVYISPKGFMFYAEGGFVANASSTYQRLHLESEKLNIEVRMLKKYSWVTLGTFAVSLAALIVSAIALFKS